MRFRCANDRRSHARLLQDPSECNLSICCLSFLRDFGHPFDDLKIPLLIIKTVGEFIRLGSNGFALILETAISSQEPAGERAPGNQPDAVSAAERIHLTLFLPVDKVVMVLHGDKASVSVLIGQIQKFGELPCVHAGSPNIERLSLIDNVSPSKVSSIGVVES